jgi:hypothetical protein
VVEIRTAHDPTERLGSQRSAPSLKVFEYSFIRVYAWLPPYGQASTLGT